MPVLIRVLSAVLNLLAVAAAVLALLFFLTSLPSATSAPQEASLAGVALAIGLLPYAFARAASEALRDVAHALEGPPRVAPSVLPSSAPATASIPPADPEAFRIGRRRSALALGLVGLIVAASALGSLLVEQIRRRDGWEHFTMRGSGGESYGVARLRGEDGAELLLGATSPVSVVVQFPPSMLVQCGASCRVSVSVDDSALDVVGADAGQVARVFIREGGGIVNRLTLPGASEVIFVLGDYTVRFDLPRPVRWPP